VDRVVLTLPLPVLVLLGIVLHSAFVFHVKLLLLALLGTCAYLVYKYEFRVEIVRLA
jgi:Na+/H+ antiporter NhaD/arsenite permease-like protein